MEENIIDDKKALDKKKWKEARWGVIIICVVHMIVSVIALAASGAEPGSSSRLLVLPILFNYWISSWYINDKIEKGKAEANLMMMGIKVAGVIFLIQVVLGTILMLSAEQQMENIINK
jgi:threonine/homoserine/homoserine lactone efflux protein